MGNSIIDKFYLSFEGIMLFQVVFFGMVYLISKRKDVLYYSLLNFTSAIFFFLNSPGIFLGIDENIVLNSPWYRYADFAIVLSMISIYSLFLKEIFGDTLKRYAYVRKTYTITLFYIPPILYSLFVMFSIMGWETSVIFNTGHLINGPFCTFIFILNYKEKGYKSLIIYGMLAVFICSILTIIFTVRYNTGSIDTIFDKYPLAIIRVGMIVDIMLFQLALLNRWNDHEKQLAMEKLQSKLAEEKLRSKISGELHDDLGSDLYKISLLSEMMKPQLTGQGRDTMDKIASSAKDSLDKMGEIVWTMNAAHDGLHNLIAYFRKFAMEYFELAGIVCNIEIPPNIPNTFLPGDKRRALLLCYKETLRNVIKHAQAPSVDITFSLSHQKLSIIIHDKGKGIDIKNGNSFGNGLANMKKRMQEAGGSFEIENRKGTGARLTIDC